MPELRRMTVDVVDIVNDATLFARYGTSIPLDATANVHSVSAIGEQYLDLVADGNPGQYFSPGQTVWRVVSIHLQVGAADDALDGRHHFALIWHGK